MALHRDIFWVGRQWAVTGSGMQAVDQRLRGMFDIEASLVWEDGIVERTRALAWLNIVDFDKALEVARARYPAGAENPFPGGERAGVDPAERGGSRRTRGPAGRNAPAGKRG